MSTILAAGLPGQADSPTDFASPSPLPGREDGQRAAPARSAGAALPCLSSHNLVQEGSFDEDSLHGVVPSINNLTGSHIRSAMVLRFEVNRFIKRHGLEFCGLLTITHRENLKDHAESQRRYHNLACNVLKSRYWQWIKVGERQYRGAWHYHLLVAMEYDIRTGVDFAAFAQEPKGDYRTASSALRAEWEFYRSGVLERYGFGPIHELLPIKTREDVVAFYLSKYIGKSIGARCQEDRGVRLVAYGGFRAGDRGATCQFAFARGLSVLWRLKVEAWATRLGYRSYEALKVACGPRWAFDRQEEILGEPLGDVVAPSLEFALLSSEMSMAYAQKLDAESKVRFEAAVKSGGRFAPGCEV